MPGSAAARTGWLAARSVLALMLSAGFYLLAFGMSAALLALPIAEVVYGNHLHVQLLLFSLGSAGAILWSLVPRRVPFAPPGPRLDRGGHPRLFAVLEDVSRRVGQRMPRDVYVVPRTNAFVSERGGVLGFGRRRYMGLGLPLMQVLSVEEMGAVLAHEFGHYHGGDTFLGPFIYRTREALERTVAELSSSLVRKPFLWYGTLYMKLTLAVSRHQERLADALAARVVGASPLASGLRKIRPADEAFVLFWQTEFAPALEAGYQPPLMQGFRAFLACRSVEQSMERVVAASLKEESQAYDTHPALAERLAALGDGKDAPPARDGPVAVELLGDLSAIESGLLEHMLGVSQVQALRPLSWDEAPVAVTLPRWRKAAAIATIALRDVTVDSLPVAASDLGKDPFGGGNELLAKRAWQLGVALGLTLHRQGFTITTAVGEDVRMVRGGVSLDPFGIVGRLASGELGAEDWRAQAVRLGIAALPLEERSAGPAASPPGAAPLC